LYSLLNITNVLKKSRRIRWTGHAGQTNKNTQHLSEKLPGDVGKICVNNRYNEREFKQIISGCGLNSTSFRTESNGKLL
jgi:hypothetical protein